MKGKRQALRPDAAPPTTWLNHVDTALHPKLMGLIFLAGVHHVLLPVLQLRTAHCPVTRQLNAVFIVTLDKQSIRAG